MKIRKVSVLVLSWNGRQHLEICLPALEEQRDPGVPWEVVVLDNGSWDGSAAWVREHHPEVRLVESPVNLGFCGGNNRLVREADGDALILLNNDTRPESHWLAAMVDAASAAPEDVAAISGQIVDWEGERLDFGRGVVTFDGHAFQHDYRRPLERAEIPAPGAELAFACGGNMLIRKTSFLAAGGFDDDYFAYLEDVDLGWRLWSGGERVIFAPEAVIHHRSMATSAMLGNANRGFLFERNAFLTAYKNLDDEHLERLLPAILLTLTNRTQTLLVQNNPGGEQLTWNPYAGLIANTAHPTTETEADGETPAESPAEPVFDTAPVETNLAQKWRGYGPREFFRRGVRKGMRMVLPAWVFDGGQPADIPHLADDRTVAQLRAVSQILGHLDGAAARRRVVQARRRRSDREIFERFPLYVVPTYPGDERLFESSAFRELLGDEIPLEFADLATVMELG